MIDESIFDLVNYALRTGLIEESDRVWAENSLIAALGLDGYTRPKKAPEARELEEILKELLDYAEEKGIIEGGVTERDLLDARLMGLLTPRPAVARAPPALASWSARTRRGHITPTRMGAVGAEKDPGIGLGPGLANR